MAKRFIQNNFYTFASGTMIISVAFGWMGLSYMQDRQKHRIGLCDAEESPRSRSREEMRLQAMIENALKSSWQENLDAVFEAQARFMLPGRDHGSDPKFVKKIDQRADELMKMQVKSQEEKERLRKSDEADLMFSIPQASPAEEETSETKIQFWQ